jgi:hypothetical protein
MPSSTFMTCARRYKLWCACTQANAQPAGFVRRKASRSAASRCYNFTSISRPAQNCAFVGELVLLSGTLVVSSVFPPTRGPCNRISSSLPPSSLLPPSTWPKQTKHQTAACKEFLVLVLHQHHITFTKPGTDYGSTRPRLRPPRARPHAFESALDLEVSAARAGRVARQVSANSAPSRRLHNLHLHRETEASHGGTRKRCS